MKPLRLEIEGLNSFEKRQGIDFERLSGDGLFGIFGDTGSGKSTVIDAITLALYGRVARYDDFAGKRQFINANSENAYVSFEFSLNETDRYTVARAYKRTGDGVKQYMTRLFHNGILVIENKAQQADEQIAEIIGLGYMDFTRSIILPQGKFSEFLMSKDRERRDMLERIFRLERFGSELIEKIRADLNESFIELKAAQSEYTRFKDATEENLAAKIIMYDRLTPEIALLTESIDENIAKQSILNEYVRLILERGEYKNELASLCKQSARISELREKIIVSERSAAVMVLLDELNRLKNKHNELVSAEEIHASKLNELEFSEKKLRDTHLSAVKDRNEKLPLLIKSEMELKSAIELQKQYEPLSVELNHSRIEYKKVNENYKNIVSELAALDDEQKRDTAQLSELNISIEKLRVPAQVRHEADQAFVRFNEYTRLKNDIEQVDKKYSSKEIEYEKAREQFECNKNECKRLIHVIGMRLNSNKAKINISEKEITESENNIVELTNMIGAMRAKNHLFGIRSMLIDGETCPLCGSKDHPAPFVGGFQDYEKLESDLKINREQCEILKRDHVAFVANTETLTGILSELESCYTENNAGEIIGTESNFESKEINDWDNNEKIDINNIKSNRSVIERGLTRYFLELKTCRNELSDLSAKRQELINLMKAAGHIEGTPNPANELDRIRACDKQLEAINAEVDVLRNKIDKNTILILNKTNSKSELNGKLGELTAFGKELANQLSEMQAQLERLSGGKEPNSALQAVQSQLLSIAENERRAEDALSKAAELRRETENALIAVKSERVKLEEELNNKDAAVGTALHENRFADAEEAERGFISTDELVKLKQEIENHDAELIKQGNNLQLVESKLKKFDSGLSGISPDTLAEQIKKDKIMLIEKNELLILLKSEIDKLKNDLIAKENLEERLSKITAENDRLTLLSSVLRAGAFVGHLSKGYLKYITKDASERVREMTSGRYSLELDGYDFIIRDDGNGGIRRSPRTLSGGETFIVSLALALALSQRIQLQNKAPLEFFFLDEGFGSLDPATLDTVVDCLSGLRGEKIKVGLISHVNELKNRVNKKLVIIKTDDGAVVRYD